MTRYVAAICCLTAWGLSVGCDGQPAERAVAGTVTYAGKPLDHGMIMFQPSTGRPTGAPLASDGSYSISLAPGNYSVYMNSPAKLPEGFKEGDPLPPADPTSLPGKYSRKETSGLTAKIDSGGGEQTLDFDLQ